MKDLTYKPFALPVKNIYAQFFDWSTCLGIPLVQTDWLLNSQTGNRSTVKNVPRFAQSIIQYVLALHVSKGKRNNSSKLFTATKFQSSELLKT